MTNIPSRAPARSAWFLVGQLARWAALAALAAILSLQLVFFAIHASQLLAYPYPLDYGEGPLLAQINLLRAGRPIWQLYANPDLPPYAVVNYPPVYLLTTAALALASNGQAGAILLAGRLISLASALAAVLALWQLAGAARRPAKHTQPAARVARLLIALAFLALPIVREWSVLLRVDLLGVCLGLWGLVIVQRQAGRRALLWAAILLALSLLVKPSLIAAPAAALAWLLFRDWRRALLLGLLVALLGGLVVALLQLGSGGWFLLHVLAANANTWQAKLAYGFWHDQLVILWPLVAAGGLAAAYQLAQKNWRSARETAATSFQLPRAQLLPIYYTLFGAVVAYGVGKVGAYTNYFLEFYAGLIWLAAAGCAQATEGRGQTADGARQAATDGNDRTVSPAVQQSRQFSTLSFILPILVIALVVAAQLRYYPTWSATYLKPAGIIEGQNPPRIVAGRYGVWQDLRRERDILATLSGVNATLDREVRAARAPIFTDLPGLAAQSGQLARLQAFEYRQLLDAGLADQSGLLRDLANGQTPLVVLDYLGNWLTPEMIALIANRYAQTGSSGAYDLYRPVDPGPAVAVERAFPGGLELASYHLAQSPGRPAYHGGETVLLALDWRARAPTPAAPADEVVVELGDDQGNVLLAWRRRLVYGALAPNHWGSAAVQHLQPLDLPAELLPATYQLSISLRAEGRDLGSPQRIAPLVVEQPAGRQIGEAGYYVPAPLLDAWQQLGGDEPAGPGDPVMPAAPFEGFTLQCFTRACLRLENGAVQRLPLGELLRLADAGLQPAGAGANTAVGNDFRQFWASNGAAATLGPALTNELVRGDRIVQYTRYARLERPIDGGETQLGRLGEEFLRLPLGVPYRWPWFGRR